MGAILVLAVSLVAGSSAVLGESLDLEGWVEARTENFVLRSNAAPERAEEIARTLEGFRSAFALLAPELELKSPVPTRILAFRDEASFDSFKSGQDGRGRRILGQFLTHPDANFITLNADPRLLGGVGVVLHEYVHYLVSHNLPGVPRWFNEGLAEYYSTFVIEDDRAVIGRPVERHLAWLRRHERLDIASILEAGNSRGSHSEVDAGHFYAASWGLVHFLLSSSDLSRELSEFLVGTSDADASRRFEGVFGVRIDELEEELERYLLSQTPRARGVPIAGLAGAGGVGLGVATPASVLSDLAALRLRLGDEIAAGQLYDLAIAYEPDHGDAYAGLAHVRDVGSRHEEAELLFAKGLELGVDEARSYLLYGRHLLIRLEEARRIRDAAAIDDLARRAALAFRAATELMPGYAEALALQGMVHLYGQLEPGDGVPHLERALELLPGRVDLFFNLLQLEVRRGGEARARRLAAGPIRRLGGEEWGLRADEEIERVGLLRSADEALGEGRFVEGKALVEAAIAITTDDALRQGLVETLARLERERDSREP